MKRRILIHDHRHEIFGQNTLFESNGDIFHLASILDDGSSSKRQRLSSEESDEERHHPKKSSLMTLLTSVATILSMGEEQRDPKIKCVDKDSTSHLENRQGPKQGDSEKNNVPQNGNVPSRRTRRSVSLCEEDVKVEEKELYSSFEMEFPPLPTDKNIFKTGICCPPRLPTPTEWPQVAPLAIGNLSNGRLCITSRNYGKQRTSENVGEYGIKTNNPLSPTRIRIRSVVYE